mgnify:CR=1 FL=1
MSPKSTIQIRRIRFRGEDLIGMYFVRESWIVKHVKDFGARWRTELGCWVVPAERDMIYRMFSFFKPLDIWIDQRRLEHQALTIHEKKKNRKDLIQGMTEEKREVYDRFIKYLSTKRYSPSTCDTYGTMAEVFLGWASNLELEKVTLMDIDRFNHEFIIGNGYSVSYQRQMVGALKILFGRIIPASFNIEELERPVKEKKLPVVLSQKEIMVLIQRIENFKHRTLIATIYACGLRISEVLDLRWRDLDFGRKVVHVRQSKGRKDRVINLSPSLAVMLERYYKVYAPEEFVFNGQEGGKYTAPSVRAILRRATRRAGIQKHVTPHTLRHSYATHLLENGINLRYVQELLGHRKPETTMIYTHVMQKDLENIASPFDAIVQMERETPPGLPDKDNPNLLLS